MPALAFSRIHSDSAVLNCKLIFKVAKMLPERASNRMRNLCRSRIGLYRRHVVPLLLPPPAAFSRQPGDEINHRRLHPWKNASKRFGLHARPPRDSASIGFVPSDLFFGRTRTVETRIRRHGIDLHIDPLVCCNCPDHAKGEHVQTHFVRLAQGHWSVAPLPTIVPKSPC